MEISLTTTCRTRGYELIDLYLTKNFRGDAGACIRVVLLRLTHLRDIRGRI